MPENPSPIILPASASDGFLLGLRRMMTKSGQGEHTGITVVDCMSRFDLEVLRKAADALLETHPILAAPFRRHPITRLPGWIISDPGEAQIAITHFHDQKVEPECANSIAVSSLDDIVPQLLGISIPPSEQGPKISLHLFKRSDGEHTLLISWLHLLLDGIGIQLLTNQLIALYDAICNDRALPELGGRITSDPPVELPLLDRIRGCKPVTDFFRKLVPLSIRSLGGRRTKRGNHRALIRVLDETSTARALEVLKSTVGEMMSLPHFAAVATRAHHAIHLQRSPAPPKNYIINVPVQTRPRTGDIPIFTNLMAIYFFKLTADELDDLNHASKSIIKQYSSLIRSKFDQSFTHFLSLLRRVPAAITFGLSRVQFHGEVNSFFHSHSGEFTIRGGESLGISNAFHIPGVSSPPGTGLFFSTHKGTLTITLSYLDSAITELEARQLVEHAVNDLLNQQGHTNTY